ncbi:hypothetical protein GF378_00020 [Candidatus Pacearchaeota archaeon]|nr:hypothetical protein [Candidatus Pacearchaeota archaeon]
MAKKSQNEKIGKAAFVIGLVLAVVGGLLESVYVIPYTVLILVILGLLVGFMNIANKDNTRLLLAIVALIAVGASTVQAIPTLDVYLNAMLQNFVAFVGAAGFVVAIKEALATTKA